MDQAVLIAGCGDVGIALGRKLARAGTMVYGLRRETTHLPPEIIPVQADLSRPLRFSDLPSSLWGVVFLPSSRRDAGLYRQIRVTGFDNLHQALMAAHCTVRRWIYVSSTSVYGQDSGEDVDEQSAVRPQSETARILLQGEDRMQALSLPGTRLRFAGIYGPGREMMLRKVMEGSACKPGLWTNRIHRDDCASMLHHLLDAAHVDNAYIGVDNQPALQCDVMRWLAEQLDVAAVVPTIDAPYSGKQLSNKRIRQTGFSFRYSNFTEGYESMIRTFLERTR